MSFFLIHYWGWMLAALLLGGGVGWLAWSNEPRDGWFVGWLRWWGTAFLVGLAIALTKIIPGRAGLYVETALWLFAIYIIGCFLGGWLRALSPPEEIAASAPVAFRSEPAAGSAPVAVAEAAVPAAPPPLPGSPPSGLSARPEDVHDLTRIRGIGPANQKALNDLGVWRYDQIADWSADNASWVSAKLGSTGRVAREDWMGQARLLAAGGDTAFSGFVKSGSIKPGADADEPLSDADIAVVNGDIASGFAALDKAKAEAAAKAEQEAKAAAAKAMAEFDARAAAQAERARVEKEAEEARLAAFEATKVKVEAEAAAKAHAEAEAAAKAEAEEGARAEQAARDAAESKRRAQAEAATKAEQESAALAAASMAAEGSGDSGKPAALAAPHDATADDLKLIKGIGPKNEQICNALGVFHFAQIADWSPENAKWVNAHIRFPGRIERERWIDQAKLLAAGVDTSHSAAVKSGAIVIDDKADEPLSEEDAQAFAAALPKQMETVEGEDQHEGRRPLGLADARGGKADDLKRIKGNGKQNEARLHALGVWHFDQIAAWSEQNIKWVGSYLAFPGRITREDWINQAKQLATGGDTEFSKRVAAGKVASSKDDGSLGQSNVAKLDPH